MIVYEVNIDVSTERAEEFAAWLLPHVDEMLKFDGFDSAAVFDREPSMDVIGEVSCFTVHYQVRTRSALEAYFRDHAESMRGDGRSKFGDSFRIWRNVLIPHGLKETA